MSVCHSQSAKGTRIRDVGLALSGGGSRAIAFHLGCLRALHDDGVLQRIQVISGVSGGSVLAAMWAYSDSDFDEFEQRVERLLGRGLQRTIARRLLLGRRGPQALGTTVIAGGARLAALGATTAKRAGALLARSRKVTPVEPPLRRWVTRTDAFRDTLAAQLFGDTKMAEVSRADLGVVLNACDLRTGSAFRFGSRETGVWRIGTLPGNDIDVATAVAASAAYPLLLPALDRIWEFDTRNGQRVKRRVVLTDGGVFDNLGTSCLEPGRDPAYSTNVYDVDYVIACDAGRGLLAPTLPYAWPSRVARSFESTFRKVQDAERAALHAQVADGHLAGFVMPYLGQQDSRVPEAPAGLVPRSEVTDVATNFAAMRPETIAALTTRGEQLTRALVSYYCPELLSA